MNAPKDILEGLGFVANAARGAGQGLKAEIQNLVQEKVKECLRSMNLVTREEHEELRLMLEKLRQEQEDSRVKKTRTMRSRKKSPEA